MATETGSGELVNLDELEEEAKKLVALLEDRHPGLQTWTRMLVDQMDKVRNLIG